MSQADRIEWSRRQALQAAGFGILAAGVAGAADVPLAPPAGAADVPLAPPDKQPPNLRLPGPPATKVGWAIVGLGQLAVEEILPAFAKCEHSMPVALVSGHRDKAEKLAAKYGVDSKHIYDYASYDKLADNPDVDVVYIVLPNHMHAEYTIRAHKGGKHVLCEKPMATSTAECRQMIDAAKAAQRKLMIAYRLRYEPHNQTAIDMARKQVLGKLRLIEAVNTQVTNPPNIRLSKSTAGGPMGDIGIYCLNATRYLTGEEPIEVSATAQPGAADDPRFKEVLEGMSFQLRFPSGVVAVSTCSFGVAESRRFRAHCTDGWFELDPAFSYRGLRMRISQGKEKKELQLPEVNHFTAEMDHFSKCVAESKEPLTPGEEGLRDVSIIEKIEESARNGSAIKL